MRGYGADDSLALNLVSALIGLENSPTVGKRERWLDVLLDWMRGPGERGLKRTFGAWIRRVLLTKPVPGSDSGTGAYVGEDSDNA